MIPFVDLKAQYHGIKQEVDAAISNVLDSGEFILGSQVAAFEEEFAAYCGSKCGVGVNSGTSASLAFLLWRPLWIFLRRLSSCRRYIVTLHLFANLSGYE